MNQQQRTAAERLDDAVGHVLDGVAAPVASSSAGPELRPLVDLAGGLRAALAPPPVAPRFEARLGARLSGVSRDPLAWALGHPGRLIVTGALGSAVGVGVTAYAVWRSGRRAHRLQHR